MLPATLLFQTPVTPLVDMDPNMYQESCGSTDANARATPTGLHDPLAPAEPPMGFFPSSPPPSAGPSDYSFVHALSAITSIQQNQPPAPPPPQLSAFVQPRRSFDMSALHLHPQPAAASHQPGYQQHQGHPMPPPQYAPLFPPPRHPMHDGGFGAMGLSRPASIRPQSGHSVQSLSSTQSYIETASDGAVATSSSQEAAAATGSSATATATASSDLALLLSGALQVKRDTSGKPQYPYATLITYAILKHPRKQMTLSEIYTWLVDHYPYFKTAGNGWKNSIRHNLSLNKMFVRIPRPINEPGKGAYWSVDLVELNDALSTRGRPSSHRYSPPRKSRACSAGTHSAARAMPPPPLAIGAGPAGLRDPMLMVSVTSSISEMGVLSSAPEGLDPASRRASLQMSPVHRYQPYGLPPHAGMGAFGPYQNMPPLPVMAPPAYGSSVLPMPAFALQPSLHSPVPSQPPPGIVGAQAATALPPVQPPPVQPPFRQPFQLPFQPPPVPTASVGRERSGSLGSSMRTPAAEAAGRMAALSLRGRQQVRTTPSLPDSFLAPHRAALRRDSAAPSGGSVAGDSQTAFGPATGGPFLQAPAGGDRARVPVVSGGAAPGAGGGTGVGDFSAYLAYMDAQHPPSSA